MTDAKRYTVTTGDRAAYMHHVVDTEDDRVVASCTAGTHEENRRDAERIARLMNDEIAKATTTPDDDAAPLLPMKWAPRDGSPLLATIKDGGEELTVSWSTHYSIHGLGGCWCAADGLGIYGDIHLRGWRPAEAPAPDEVDAMARRDDLMRDCAAYQRRIEAWRREVSESLGLVPPEGRSTP